MHSPSEYSYEVQKQLIIDFLTFFWMPNISTSFSRRPTSLDTQVYEMVKMLEINKSRENFNAILVAIVDIASDPLPKDHPVPILQEFYKAFSYHDPDNLSITLLSIKNFFHNQFFKTLTDQTWRAILDSIKSNQTLFDFLSVPNIDDHASTDSFGMDALGDIFEVEGVEFDLLNEDEKEEDSLDIAETTAPHDDDFAAKMQQKTVICSLLSYWKDYDNNSSIIFSKTDTNDLVYSLIKYLSYDNFEENLYTLKAIAETNQDEAELKNEKYHIFYNNLAKFELAEMDAFITSMNEEPAAISNNAIAITEAIPLIADSVDPVFPNQIAFFALETAASEVKKQQIVTINQPPPPTAPLAPETSSLEKVEASAFLEFCRFMDNTLPLSWLIPIVGQIYLIAVCCNALNPFSREEFGFFYTEPVAPPLEWHLHRCCP